jgi:AGCS family alanine or glycine:cation symporter
MCGVYVVAGLWILIVNAAEVPAAISAIVGQAFSPVAGFGGMLGVIAQGFRRASFSNEAGIGSASIAHSAAATSEPVREGIVALLEPFIDTVCVCAMTGLVVVVTGAYLDKDLNGVEMTSAAFGSVMDWFPMVLSFAVVMFAFSTMISWSYYGEKCAVWLFGEAASLPYKVLFLMFVVFGSVIKLGNVIDFSDMMILGMAVPNILGAIILSGKVKAALDEYMGKLARGEFPVHKS